MAVGIVQQIPDLWITGKLVLTHDNAIVELLKHYTMLRCLICFFIIFVEGNSQCYFT